MVEAFLLSLGILAFGWRDTPSDSSVVYPFEWSCFTWIYISGSLDALYLLESPLGAGGSSLVASGAFTTVTIHSWRAWMLCTVYASLSFSLSSVNSNTCWAQPLLNFWRASLIAEKSAAGMQLPGFSGLSLNVVLGVLFNQLSVIPKQEAVFVCLLLDIEAHKCASRRRVSPHANAGKASRDLGECHYISESTSPGAFWATSIV